MKSFGPDVMVSVKYRPSRCLPFARHALLAQTAVLAALLLTSCSPENTDASKNTTNSPPREFDVTGAIREIHPDQAKLKIAHDEIPGYMDPMTMTFAVRGETNFNRFATGQQVRFKMKVTETDGWIEEIQVTQQASADQTPASLPTQNFRVVRDVEPLNVGDVVPDYKFTNELGQAVSLNDYRGKAVAITFLFTRCPYPTFCPRMASHFAAAQTALKQATDTGTNWHLLTITFDPGYDTPAVLREYAQRYNYDPDQWSFLTGELIDITALGEQFGLIFYMPDPSRPTGIEHNLRTVVIGPDGRVRKIIKENEWQVEEIVSEMQAAMRGDAIIPSPTEP